MNTDAAYVAGLIDGEGCIHIEKWDEASREACEALKQRMHGLNQKGPRAPAHSAEVA